MNNLLYGLIDRKDKLRGKLFETNDVKIIRNKEGEGIT